jgi:hypothetical protein
MRIAIRFRRINSSPALPMAPLLYMGHLEDDDTKDANRWLELMIHG